jgi:hypothetical protein
LNNAELHIGAHKGLVLFLDKNYLPAEFEAITDAIDNHPLTQQMAVRKLALVPEISDPHEDYPFSLKFLL